MKPAAALIIISALLAVPAAHAIADTDGRFITWEKGETVEEVELCHTAENLPCTSPPINCTIVVFYPDWTVYADEVNMTFISDGFYNITLGQLNTTGLWHGTMKCQDDSVPGASPDNFTFDTTFRVSDTVTPLKLEELDMSIASVLGLGILIFAFLYVAVQLTRSDRHPPLQLLFFIIPMFLVIAMINVMNQSVLGVVDTQISGTINGVFFASMFTMIIVVAYFFVKFIFEQMEKLSETAKREGRK